MVKKIVPADDAERMRSEIQAALPRDLRETIRELMQQYHIHTPNDAEFVEDVWDLVVTQATDTQFLYQMSRIDEIIESAVQQVQTARK